jgi:O-antigen/teichoic acid export membrane protein
VLEKEQGEITWDGKQTAAAQPLAAEDAASPGPNPPGQIANRIVTGSMLSASSQGATVVLGFVRSVLLARLLAPDDVGIVSIALVITNFFASMSAFGLSAAFIQRKTAEPEAISTYFVMRVGLVLLSVVLTVACIPLFRLIYPEQPTLIPIVLALSAIRIVVALSATPMVLLQREMAFRRLAILDVLSSALMLIVAPLMAWQGWGPWSLVLGEQLTGVLVSAVGLWLYRPPWRLSLRVNRTIAGEYLRFGRFILANTQITYLLDRFDDFWVGTALGMSAAGFYAKAYEFARYPRRFIAMPLQPVFFSAYARLQDDRHRLSQAYYRLNSFVVRVGFLFALILVLIAPEFVELLLTAKWLPMVNAFRLMVVYSLFDPLIVTAGNLAAAMGQPQLLTRIKVLQAVVFVPLVILLASLWGIEGVAIAADVMLLIGIALILRYMRRFVDFSLWRLFSCPLLALFAGGAAGLGVEYGLNPPNLWVSMAGKAAAAGIAYAAVLAIFEHAEYRRNLSLALQLLRRDGRRGVPGEKGH